MGEDELGFDKDHGEWVMVTGPSGTHLNLYDVVHNMESWFSPRYGDSVKGYLETWYYDNANPVGDDSGDGGSALHPNSWSMCSSLVDGQVTSPG